jgi:hypothetical protein
MVRGLANFGLETLEHPDCERLCVVLHNLRFKVEKPRTERLTEEQAIAIRAKAHQMGRASIALAQAFQFDCKLTQKDVIGEWVPLAEEETGHAIHEDKKWIRGLRWEEISELMLRHTASNGGVVLEFDLRRAPMVMEELRLLKVMPPKGPVIICEFTGVPWQAPEFRRWWRKIADACGVPKNVKNMDSRAGGDDPERHKTRSSNGLSHRNIDTAMEGTILRRH